MRALHWLARVALRTMPPRRAKDVVDQAARALPPFASLEEARRVANALDAHGTCLSRAMTVASRLRNAEVVIGVDPNSPRDPSPLGAHAWVVVDGVPLRASDPRGEEIVRL